MRTRFFAWYAVANVLACAVGQIATGQDKLLEGPPYDEIRLNDANGGDVIEVFPLDIQGRQLPATRPEGKLEIRLLSRPGQTFLLDWSKIAEVRIYEQMLVDKANDLVVAAKFDEAFDYFALVRRDYPDLPGLEKQLSNYLRRNAVAEYSAGNFDRALALLATLREQNPRDTSLAGAVETVAGRIIQQRLRNQDYAGARAVLDYWLAEFGSIAQSAQNTWRDRFQEAAEQRLAEAQQAIARRDYLAASLAVNRAITIWPAIEGATQIRAQIRRDYPQLVVGVLEQAPRSPRRRIDCWPAMRVHSLVGSTLFELVDFGTEGGIYDSPYGETELDATGRRISLRFMDRDADHPRRPALMRAHAISHYLLAMADPSSQAYRRDFAALCAAVDVDDLGVLQIDFKSPHVQPAALLQVTLPTDTWYGTSLITRAAFQPGQRTSEFVHFEAVSANQHNRASGIEAIVEQTMPNDDAAVAALVRGDVSVLDRVPPWQLPKLESVPNVKVGQYRLPTIHCLIPNPANELLARRELRRALCYGIDRDRIVKEVLAGGSEIPGFQVISGPFPPGRSLSDPVGYAYSSQIEPRPYEPRLAATLSLVAMSNAAELRAKSAAPSDVDPLDQEFPTLTMVHSSDAIARAACESIAQQLRLIGIPIQLKELSTEQLYSGQEEYDLRYTELAVWEPLADVQALFGSRALTEGSAAIRTAARMLTGAASWKDVQRSLTEIHRIAHNDLAIIPLWQTVNYFAFRTDIVHLGDAPITLYQNVNDWQLVTEP